MDDKDDSRRAGDPLAEAVDIINKLLALCTKHELKREAYSIALGEEIPEPTKRGRGQPRKKDRYYRLSLALDAEAAQRDGKTYASVAQTRAEKELGRGVSARLAVRAKKAQIQNDISRLSAWQKDIAAFIFRSIDSGRSAGEIANMLDAAWAGDGQIIEEIQGSRLHK